MPSNHDTYMTEGGPGSEKPSKSGSYAFVVFCWVRLAFWEFDLDDKNERDSSKEALIAACSSCSSYSKSVGKILVSFPYKQI